jgi:hypothetical protein
MHHTHVQIGVSLPPAALESLDLFAGQMQWSRSHAARYLLQHQLKALTDDAQVNLPGPAH